MQVRPLSSPPRQIYSEASESKLKTSRQADEIVRLSDNLTGELVTPPRPAAGVCPQCRTWNDTDRDECSNCAEVREALGVSALTLKVVSLYCKPSALRDWLTGYKGRPERGEPRDPQCMANVEAILGRLVIEHGEDLERDAGGADCIVVVPSTDRPPPHPLEQVLIDLELNQPIRRLLRRGPGPLSFRLPSRDAYEHADHQSESLRVLLIDDVYTTGARLNSAAYTLSSAGHTVASALVIARRVNPDYSEAALAMWERQAALRFDWRTSPIITSR